jgi:hypothetical protein
MPFPRRCRRVMMAASMRAILCCTSLLVLGLTASCGDDGPSWECTLTADDPDWADQIGCQADFDAVSSEPASAAIPGARSVKTVIDRLDADHLYFQNSERYPIHFDFASMHLSGNGKPIVPLLPQFNTTEYFSPDRRFILGSVTYYDNPGVWCYEIAPYDTASAEMIAQAYAAIAGNAFFGEELYFHPTSDAITTVAAELPAEVKIMTTDELFAGVIYQPLNLGETMARLVFVPAAELDTTYVGFRDLVVLDAVPNDISVTAGIISDAFQTPLAHINVLSQNRGTPNMALRGAFDGEELRALENKWVHLVVSPFDYAIEEVTLAEADAWWEKHRPEPLGIPNIDLTVTELRNDEDVLDIATYGLDEALTLAIRGYGGKASHSSALALIEGVRWPDAFAVPVYYYWQFMETNGFHARIAELLADPDFTSDPAVKAAALQQLRDDMEAAPLDPAFVTMLTDKLNTDFAGNTRMRFRSSTNVEDLEGFTGAGLHDSKTGDPNDPTVPMENAIRRVWTSLWSFRTFEEREYRGIDHSQVAMALLVHNAFTDEEANGVAVTGNVFDTQGLEPAFYINAQIGEVSVVLPDPDVKSDQLLLYFDYPNQPIVYVGHSNLVGQDETVLTRASVQELGGMMKKVHDFYAEVYGGTPFYALEIDWKYDDGEIWLKQARPYPGWGASD